MKTKTILVVEDEEDILKTLEMILELEGFMVITASDGMKALELARKKCPDLIILDLMLPKLDGYKVCAMLKHDERYSDIPIIMFTARAQESDRKLGLEARADAYITKPLDPEILIAKIKELLGRE